MKEAILTELRGLIGPTRTFRSYAEQIPPEVQVVTKDCSYTAERLNGWAEVYWENHRPWYAPWKKCIGFTVYCPPVFRLMGNVPVTVVLERVTQKVPDALGEYHALFYRLAKGLTVRLAV